MKIYLASNYTRHPEMRVYAANLEALGHEITSRWIQGKHDESELPVSYEKDGNLWIATIEGVPGAFSQGKTQEKARSNAFDAMRELENARGESLSGQKWALEDLEDLMRADCCISFTCEPGKPQGRNRGGRHVEFGYALARGYRLIVVGFRENIFHCMPQVEFYPQYSDLMLQMAREFEEAERQRLDNTRGQDRADSLALAFSTKDLLKTRSGH